MKHNRHSAEQIIAKLRRADVELGRRKKVAAICKLLEITDQMYYRWRHGHRREALVAMVCSWRLPRS